MNPRLFFIIAGAVLAMLVIGQLTSQSQPAPTRTAINPAQAKADQDRRDSMDACIAAHKAVKGELKSPASAKFPNCVFDADKYEVRRSPDGLLTFVLGHVDSQNSFGAMVRSQYVVKFDSSGARLDPIAVTVE